MWIPIWLIILFVFLFIYILYEKRTREESKEDKTEEVTWADKMRIVDEDCQEQEFKRKMKEFEDKMDKKTIKDLDTKKIEERHFIKLEIGVILYKRTIDSNPLNFHHSNTSFTTYVPPEKLKLYSIGLNSGSNFFGFDKPTAIAETEGKEGRLYEIKVIKEINRVLDLDKICSEQNIEFPYLKIYPTQNGRNKEIESELFNLYGEELTKKRIYGIKYSSRRLLSGKCLVIYDTFPDKLDDYLSWKIADEEITEEKV